MENDLSTDLCKAVRKNDLNAIIDLISKGADVNNFDENNELPIQIAIKMNFIEIIEELIQKGANTNVKICDNDRDETLIEYAMKESDPDIVLLLVEKGATDILNNDSGETILHYAVKYDILKLVQSMIHKGINVDAKTNEGHTPLHIAAKYGQYDMVKYLCSVGADVNACTSRNSNALHFAVNKSNNALEISKFLIDNGTEVELENSFGYTPLQISLDNNIEIAKLLIEKGADVNRIYKNTHYARCNLGGTLLHWASRGYKDAIIKFLIENGANINATEKDGRTPLCLYVKHTGSPEMINYFVEHGADLYNSNGNCPLYWAFYMHNLEAQNLLIDLMEDLNVPIDSHYMRAPLHIVRNLHQMELIISKGADVNIRDKDGNTPLHLVRCLSLTKYLVKNGADVNATNYEGSTPLHVSSDFFVVEYLVEKGADVHAINNEGYTPLHLAKSVFIAEYLIEQGADVKAVTKDGKTVLHSIAEFTTCYDSHFKDAPALVHFYISKGVDVNAIDKNGDTALHLCVSNNDLERNLLEENANMNVINNEGKKPMDYDYRSFPSIMKSIKELSIICEENMSSKKIESLYIHRIRSSYMSIDDYKTTALHLIVKKCKANIIKNIFQQLKHGPFQLNAKLKNNVINAQDINHWTPLHYAAQRGDSNIVIYLLENGSMYNAETVNFETPLKLTTDDTIKCVLQLTEQMFKAVISGNYEEVVNCINSQYKIINAKDKSGNSPLYLAIFHGYIDIIELLLQNKADITQINEEGNTVLHLACTRGYKDVAEDLLQNMNLVITRKYQQENIKGNFVNVQAIDGTTALHIAAKQNDIKLVKLLLSSGASYNTKNEEGKIPVDLSTNVDVITLFKFVEELFNDAKNGKTEIIDKLQNLDSYEFQVIAFACTKQQYTLKDILKYNQYEFILEKFSKLESIKRIIEKNVNEKCKKAESSEESAEEDLGFGLFD